MHLNDQRFICFLQNSFMNASYPGIGSPKLFQNVTNPHMIVEHSDTLTLTTTNKLTIHYQGIQEETQIRLAMPLARKLWAIAIPKMKKHHKVVEGILAADKAKHLVGASCARGFAKMLI